MPCYQEVRTYGSESEKAQEGKMFPSAILCGIGTLVSFHGGIRKFRTAGSFAASALSGLAVITGRCDARHRETPNRREILWEIRPSELTVAAGVHTITISKHGYKPWERKVTVSSGKVTVAAELDR